MAAQPADDQKSRLAFLKRKFLEYYTRAPGKIAPPPEMMKREFAFLMFGERIMVRHRACFDMGELLSTVTNLVPSDVYYSTAYYQRPMEDMDHKGWLGSDLVFDIDADHIDTPCKATHDVWVCTACKEARRGRPPVLCPKCKSTKIEARAWMCEICIGAAKNEVKKLLAFLTNDFGFSGSDAHLVFSGHRGYHLHVRSDKVMRLNDLERKEIVDYLLGLGLDPTRHGLYKKPADAIVGPERNEPGWRGRLAQGFYEILLDSSEQELVDLGFKKRHAQRIVKERDRIAADWYDKMRWGEFEDAFGLTEKGWVEIIQKAVAKKALPAKIDTVVTTDIHRLIRLPETLNGKTGFRAMPLELEELDSFDAFTHPVAFSGEAKVRVSEAPSFRLAGKALGPFKDETIVLPTEAAVLLTAKGMATPVAN